MTGSRPAPEPFPSWEGCHLVAQNDWIIDLTPCPGKTLLLLPRRHRRGERTIPIYRLASRIARGRPPRRLAETLAAFLARYDNPVTRQTYAKVLRPLAAELGPHRALAAITPEELDAWQQRLRDRGLAAATLASRTKAVKTFWNWCVRREYIARSPARFLAVKRPQQALISKAIPGDVLAAMWAAAQRKRSPFLAARDTAILALLITFGARAGDVARLRLSGVDLDHRQIVFRVKGDTLRRLPLPPQTARHVAAWLAIRARLDPDPEHDYVFVNIHTRPGHRYGPLASGSISTLINRLSARVSGRAYGPHAIRHWRGQTLADERLPPTIVQAILGHSDVRITLEHYYNQDASRVRRVLETYELGQGLAAT